jgi:Leucine-rich repeat (LRR) protein
LANLKLLSWVDLRHTQVADLTPLANLGRLETLLISHTPVSDITPFYEWQSADDAPLSDYPQLSLRAEATLVPETQWKELDRVNKHIEVDLADF